MPVTREKRRGEGAWQECAKLRAIAIGFESLVTVNLILWIWIPVPSLAWEVSPAFWPSVSIGLAILVPGGIVMYKGMKDAGSEAARPSPDTKMYGGIYQYIRHPQTLGEMPMFIALGFIANSWFLVVSMTVYILIYTPIMLHFEEKDLVLRFGDDFRAYQQQTGLLLPRFHKNSKK